MLKNNAENITDWFEDDVLVVDRGFRDVREILKGYEINSHMLHFLTKSQNQFTTEEANDSRLGTKWDRLSNQLMGELQSGRP